MDKTKKRIPWADPWIDGPEKKEVNSVFNSGWFGMGPKTKLFEDRVARYIGIKHAVAVSNGTMALNLALQSQGIGPGDEVILPAMTFVATLSAILYQQASPVFADIERDTFNIDPASCQRLISKKTKAVVFIDYGGNPADIEGLRRISRKYGIPLIQDGAQSFGGEYRGEKLCRQGLISTTSFHIAKLITTIEGGMIFTEDDKTALMLRMMRNHGEGNNEKYIHRVLGTNARMTDLQASFGLIQLGKLQEILKRRAEVAEYYYSIFRSCDKIRLPRVRAGCRNAWFFIPVLVENRDSVALKLKRAGIDTRIAYPMPVYEQPFFRRSHDRRKRYDCPNAKWMTERVLNLPVYQAIREDELRLVAETLLKALH